MKNYLLRIAVFCLLLCGFTSCELVGDIFQAGIGVGVFLVIAVIAVIIWIISRFRR